MAILNSALHILNSALHILNNLQVHFFPRLNLYAVYLLDCLGARRFLRLFFKFSLQQLFLLLQLDANLIDKEPYTVIALQY